jgi:hypothetical protein
VKIRKVWPAARFPEARRNTKSFVPSILKIHRPPQQTAHEMHSYTVLSN